MKRFLFATSIIFAALMCSSHSMAMAKKMPSGGTQWTPPNREGDPDYFAKGHVFEMYGKSDSDFETAKENGQFYADDRCQSSKSKRVSDFKLVAAHGAYQGRCFPNTDSEGNTSTYCEPDRQFTMYNAIANYQCL